MNVLLIILPKVLVSGVWICALNLRKFRALIGMTRDGKTADDLFDKLLPAFVLNLA